MIENQISNKTGMNKSMTKPARWFYVVAALALIWNVMGVMAYISQIMMSPEMLLKMPTAEQELFNAIPYWADVAFACAVFSGVFASLALLLKRDWAIALFFLSLLGALIQMYHAFFMSNSLEVYGLEGMIMPLMIIIIASLLLWLAFIAKKRDWLI